MWKPIKTLKRSKAELRYLASQDEALIKNLLFVLERPRVLFRAIFFRNSGSDFIQAGQHIEPNLLIDDINRATGISTEELWKFYEEFENDSMFHDAMLGKMKLTAERPHVIPDYGWRKFLYLVVRGTKPNIMVETGSFDGLGTAVILLAMNKNNLGHLYTIDLPNPRLPADIKAEPAWVVPEYLRERLYLKKGTSAEHLKSIIAEVGENIDIFYHDSWHTYKNMIFEYQTAWKAIRFGGFLMSEYLPNLNNAFKDFTKDKIARPITVANDSQFILRKL